MSGRSAYVRAKNTEQADKRAYKEYAEHHDEGYLYGYTGAPMTRSHAPSHPSHPSYRSPLSPPPHIRRRSQSSAGSAYGYPTAPHLKPRPIVIASAIEKSDFRTHLDGMSNNLRGKLGGLIKGGKKELEKPKRRPGTNSSATESDFEFQSRSTDVTTPSIGAVPSLSHSSTVPSEAQSLFSSQPSYSLPTREKQSKQHESVINKIRRFEGGGKLPQLGWKSLSNNPELWDENGDTFVYMYMRGSRTKPPPSFRVNSRVIEQSGSKLFMDKLHNVDEPDGWPKFRPHGFTSAQSESSDYHSESYDGFPTPSRVRSEDSASDSDGILPAPSARRPAMRAPRGIRYEIYVQWPGQETGIHSTIWHITTRNFFAVMYDASSLVGTTLHEAITRLAERITTYPDYLDRKVDHIAWLTDYLVRHKFDDVRNNPSYAASILAFSENPTVQWREGYIEAFVHCVGMLDMGLQTIPEWRYITPHTKMYLMNASMEIEERVHRAQAWLYSFDFAEMWPTGSSPTSVSRGCFDRLRKWICKYYENAFLHWPPTGEQTWLSRDLVVRLRNDFYGLYDYLVDRDIIFEGPEHRSNSKWTISSRSGQNFRADSFELPFTDMLVTFDNRNEFPHMPHPCPITPPSVPVQSKSKSAFGLNKKNPSPAETIAQTRRKALSYAEASNVYTLRDQYVHTDLVTNFIRFEQSDHLENLDPFEARRGRWLLIYGILQILATVTVDSPNLRYKEGVQYHLCPQMKGVVPWAERGAPAEEEAEHRRSHCWTVPGTWGPAAPKARPNAHKPILWGPYGDGRGRGESMDSIPTTRQQTNLIDGKTTSNGGVGGSGGAGAGGSISSVREASIGRRRAEEWVANTTAATIAAGANIGSLERSTGGGGSSSNNNNNSGSIHHDGGMNSEPSSSTAHASEGRGGNVTAQSEDDSGGGEDSDSPRTAAAEARRRRALVHGFTDFQVPSEW